jgi:hypothetical protein
VRAQLPLESRCCCEPTCLPRYAKQHNWPLDETDFRHLTPASSVQPARGGSSGREGQSCAVASASPRAVGGFGGAAEDCAAVEATGEACGDHGAPVAGKPKGKASKKKKKGKRDSLGDDDAPWAADVAAAADTLADTLADMQLASHTRLGVAHSPQRKLGFAVLASDEGEGSEGGDE